MLTKGPVFDDISGTYASLMRSSRSCVRQARRKIGTTAQRLGEQMEDQALESGEGGVHSKGDRSQKLTLTRSRFDDAVVGMLAVAELKVQ
jgi:hypothetical protein